MSARVFYILLELLSLGYKLFTMRLSEQQRKKTSAGRSGGYL